MRLFLIRHGQSVANTVPDDLPDSPLTELGRQQAETTAQFLRQLPFEHIVSSPLLRCLATAAPLASELGLPVQVWEDLVEVRNQGPYVGPARSTLMQQFPRAVFTPHFTEDGWVYSGVESHAESMARAERVIQKLRTRYLGSVIAVFAHGTFNSYLIQAALGLNGEGSLRFHQSNCCINVLDLDEGATKISVLNNRCHLPAEKFGPPGWLKEHLDA